MPIIYGESAKVFYHVQLEIFRRSSDQTVLVWGRSITFARLPRDLVYTGSHESLHEGNCLLAPSPTRLPSILQTHSQWYQFHLQKPQPLILLNALMLNYNSCMIVGLEAIAAISSHQSMCAIIGAISYPLLICCIISTNHGLSGVY